jgi:hypothetical protein
MPMERAILDEASSSSVHIPLRDGPNRETRTLVIELTENNHWQLVELLYSMEVTNWNILEVPLSSASKSHPN